MGTVIQDTYSGGVATNLTSHSPDVNVPGGSPTGYADFNFAPALKTNGAGACTSAAVHGTIIQGNVLQNGNTANQISDYSASIDVVVPNQAVVLTYLLSAGILVRFQDGSLSGHSWYVGIKNVLNTINGYKVVLGQLPSGTETALTSGLSLNNSTHTLKVTCSGNVFTIFLDGVAQGSPVTDPTYNTAKGVGPFVVNDGTFPNTTLDNLLVETVPLVITTATLPNGQVSTAYSQTITSQGGYQPTVTYAVTAGALPTGLTLSAAGVISGTPTAPGTYPFSVTASDSLGDSSAAVMYTLTITGGAFSRYLVRPDPQPGTESTRRFEQQVSQILNGLMYSGAITVTSGGIFTVGGISIGATVTGGTYTGGTGGDVLFVGVGGKLAQDNNFTFLETALGGPNLTVTGGSINAPGGLVTSFNANFGGEVQCQSMLLNSSFPIGTGFFVANDDALNSGVAAWIDWGNLVPGPNFPSHVFENATGGLTARAVVGILQSGTAPLLAGLSNISITLAPNFLFSFDQNGYLAGPGATFTGTSATTFVVTNGTNNVFQVDASVASTATGVKITGQTAGSGARVAAISSAGTETLDLDSKGAVAVQINTHAGAATGAGAAVLGSLFVTCSQASALVVGRQGSTNPAFRVAASTTALTGVLVTGQATGSTGALIAVISSATNEPLRIDAKGSGTIGIGLTSTGIITLGQNTAITGTETITSTNSSALTVGRQGATNPVLQVDASAATVVTGLSIVGAASGGGVGVNVISSAATESMTITPKGLGAIVTVASQLTVTGELQATAIGGLSFSCGDVVNPAFQVQTVGTGSGLQISSQVAGSGLQVFVTSSGTNENLTIDAKNTGTITLNGTATGKVVARGTSTNDSAAAGFIGEVVSSLVAVGGALSISAATAKNITSISLTAGDWDVEGNVNITTAAATFSGLQAGLSSTSATLPTDGSECYSGIVGTLLSDTDTITLPRKRISLAAPGTVYLVAYCNVISAGTVSGFGGITARRVR